VAREFPGIKMVVAHVGYPWSGELVAMLRKHENLYTDISAHVHRPWFLYNALVAAVEYGAQDKILFGSDYPPATARETAAALRRINDFAQGTPLPKIPSEVIEAIIERDSLALLGISA
jgi:predicted TIM-barrel fold metal-dependent hydrolase